MPQAMRPRARRLSDGALKVVVEALPSLRVRVARMEMEEGALVKLMSEEMVLERLDKGLSLLDKRSGSENT